MYAASAGNIAAIQEWFSTGTRNPNDGDEFLGGVTMLDRATYGGHIELMRILLAHGASVDASKTNGSTALHSAAWSGQHDAAVLLLDNGAQVDARTTDGRTPLFSAMEGGRYSPQVTCLLLHRGADINARDEYGGTAETHALSRNYRWTAALLAGVRRAGGWRPYVRYPRFCLLMLRILAEQGRAETQDALLRHLFPAGPPAPKGTKRPREAYRAQKGGRIPRGIFAHIFGYWRSSRDYAAPAPDGD